MTTSVFQFGEIKPEYPVAVLNERTVRAAAGILFVFALISFMNAWLMGNFFPTKVFVCAFLIEFTIRIFINPKYAPVMVLAQWLVKGQQPEYTGAPQKRFAWSIGFVLAATMFYLVVLKSVVGPINIIVCASCLALMFFETSFGICIGCKIYNLFNKSQAQLCPGNSCDISTEKQNNISKSQLLVLVLFVASVATLFNYFSGSSTEPALSAAPSEVINQEADAKEAERCKVPDFAKAMGHEEKWKLHNNCK
jgi:hypothetical protein